MIVICLVQHEQPACGSSFASSTSLSFVPLLGLLLKTPLGNVALSTQFSILAITWKVKIKEKLLQYTKVQVKTGYHCILRVTSDIYFGLFCGTECPKGGSIWFLLNVDTRTTILFFKQIFMF